MTSFRDTISREAEKEVERILSDLASLKFEAHEMIHVLNSLKLPVPKELRELAPIEQVPKPLPEPPIESLEKEIKKGYSFKGKRKDQVKSEETYQSIRSGLLEMLAAGPLMRNLIYEQAKAYGFTDYAIGQAFKRMRKAGEIRQRTVGKQGPSEWFLPSKPVRLETLRDEVVKKEGKVSTELMDKYKYNCYGDFLSQLDELVRMGILTQEGKDYFYNKPKAQSVPKVHQNGKRVVTSGREVAGSGRSSKLTSSKEVQQILIKAEKMGAQVKKQGNNHIYVEYNGKHRILAATPGDGNRSNREKLKDLGINV